MILTNPKELPNLPTKAERMNALIEAFLDQPPAFTRPLILSHLSQMELSDDNVDLLTEYVREILFYIEGDNLE